MRVRELDRQSGERKKEGGEMGRMGSSPREFGLGWVREEGWVAQEKRVI